MDWKEYHHQVTENAIQKSQKRWQQNKTQMKMFVHFILYACVWSYWKKRKRKANAKTNSDSSAKLKKIVLVMLFKFITNMQSTLCLTFSVHVRTIQCLNYSGQDSKTKLTGYDSYTPVTLKRSRSSSRPPGKITITQSLKKYCFNGVWGKANV